MAALRRPSMSGPAFLLSLVLLVNAMVCGSGYVALILVENYVAWQEEVQDLDGQLARVRAGEDNGVFLYDVRHTSRIVARLRDEPGVQELGFEMTVLSDADFAVLAELPNLRLLSASWGTRPSLTPHDLDLVARLPHLDTLEFSEAEITLEGVAHLAGLARLRHLTIHSNGLPPGESIGAIRDALMQLVQLETLDLTGRWINAEAIDSLRQALPQVQVNSTQHDHGGVMGYKALLERRRQMRQQREARQQAK